MSRKRKNNRSKRDYKGLSKRQLILEILHYPIKFQLSEVEVGFLKNIDKMQHLSIKQQTWFENILSRGYNFRKEGPEYIIHKKDLKKSLK